MDRAYSERYLRRSYGITLTEYERLLEKQHHRCAICGGEGFLMDKNRHRIKLVVDHNHSTGEVRGLLCHNCNRALGLLHDDENSLRKALSYLQGATTIPYGSRAKTRPEAHGSGDAG